MKLKATFLTDAELFALAEQEFGRFIPVRTKRRQEYLIAVVWYKLFPKHTVSSLSKKFNLQHLKLACILRDIGLCAGLDNGLQYSWVKRSINPEELQ